MRCFLAFPVPEQIREELNRVCSGLPHTSWTKPENFHITIQFFPNLEDSDIERLYELLKPIKISKIETIARGLGTFKHPRGNMTIWLGLENQKEIIGARTKIIDTIKTQGFSIEKKYEPHLTVGRCKQFIQSKWDSYFESFHDFQTSPFSIERFTLFQSTLSPNGSIYEELFSLGSESENELEE